MMKKNQWKGKKFLFAFLLFSSFTFAQEIPYEEKAKYEKFLAQKVEDVVIKVLGPNQAKAMVEIEMDFTRTEKIIYEKNPKRDFIRQDAAGDISGIEYLMPGFGISVRDDENKSYSKQFIFPSSFVKKIKVTLLVNKSLEETTIVSIKDIAYEVLNLDEKRGDEIVIVRSEFAPLWKNIWYNQESMNFIVKYIILSFLGIISLVIVAIGFLKLAGAMNTMAKVQQSHQITMELSGAGEGFTGSSPMSSMASLGSIESKKQDLLGAEKAAFQEESEKIYFNIKPHQIDALVELMVKENPSNVAIVVNHLPENIKNEFLSRLPKDFVAEIIAGLSNIRFLEQEAIMSLKDELETRLSGAVGGLRDVLDSMEKMTYTEKSAMIKTMEKKYPELAFKLRNILLLPDDIYSLDENHLSILVSATSMDDWAIVYSKIPFEFRERLKAQFSDTAWKIIEEKNKYEKPSDKFIEDSVSNIIGVLEKLIKEGRVKKPVYEFNYNQEHEKITSKGLIGKPFLEKENEKQKELKMEVENGK